MRERDYDFITDRLAIGNVASRATPGFVAVVSVLSTSPWDEVTGAPEVPNSRAWRKAGDPTVENPTVVMHIDLADGETPEPTAGQEGGNGQTQKA